LAPRESGWRAGLTWLLHQKFKVKFIVCAVGVFCLYAALSPLLPLAGLRSARVFVNCYAPEISRREQAACLNAREDARKAAQTKEREQREAAYKIDSAAREEVREERKRLRARAMMGRFFEDNKKPTAAQRKMFVERLNHEWLSSTSTELEFWLRAEVGDNDGYFGYSQAKRQVETYYTRRDAYTPAADTELMRQKVWLAEALPFESAVAVITHAVGRVDKEPMLYAMMSIRGRQALNDAKQFGALDVTPRLPLYPVLLPELRQVAASSTPKQALLEFGRTMQVLYVDCEEHFRGRYAQILRELVELYLANVGQPVDERPAAVTYPEFLFGAGVTVSERLNGAFVLMEQLKITPWARMRILETPDVVFGQSCPPEPGKLVLLWSPQFREISSLEQYRARVEEVRLSLARRSAR
jgi:hypothetical protein